MRRERGIGYRVAGSDKARSLRAWLASRGPRRIDAEAAASPHVAVDLQVDTQAESHGHVRGGARHLFGALLLAVLSFAGACSSQPSSPPAKATPPIASVPRDAGPTPDDTTPRAGDAARAQAQPAAGEWDIDLARDERRGGHTLARHVGRTDAQLKARLARESVSAASTYADRETAERVVARVLAENARRVQRWIDQRAPKPNLAVRYRARDGLPTGRLLRRGDAAAEDVEGAVVVLRWRGEDWYVLTSYPEDVR